MSAEGNRINFTRGKSAKHRSMLIACGAVCSAAMLSFMAPGAQATGSYVWTSSSSGNWSDGTKWMGGTAPAVDPSGDDSLEFSAAGTYTANNDLGPFGIYNTTFDSGNGTTTLTGGDINLAWPLTENNNPALANNSTNPVTINNNVSFVSNLAQSGTGEYFVLAPGSTTTFNGSMTINGGASLKMTNGQATSSLGGPGGTTIWTQPVTFTNSTNNMVANQFDFRIFEGNFEMGGYTIDNGISNNPIINVSGVNVLQTTGSDGKITAGPNMGAPGAPNNGAVTNMFIGPEDYESNHPNDAAAFYLIAGGNSMNQPVQIGDAGTTTIGGVNTSGTVTYNDFFKTLPSDGNGVINGVTQTIYYSAAAGGTVLQNFALIRGGGSGFCAANVNKIGPGIWIVAGGGDNDQGEQAYHGNTTVRDGTLELAYDDTGINSVTLPLAALTAGTPYYGSGLDGGSLGFNDASNAVQLGDSGTLPTDNIALLTLNNPGLAGPRQVLHNISVNNNNSSGTTTVGVADNGTGNFSGTIALNKSVVLTGGTGGVANFSGMISGVGGVTVNGTGTVNLSVANNYGGGTTVKAGLLVAGLGFSSVGTGNVTMNGGSAIFRNTTSTAVFNKLKTGLNAGAGYWNGNGINSATAAGDTRRLTTVGMMQPVSATTYNGQSLGTADVVVKYTYYGDADLNGTVNGADYQLIDNGFGSHATGWQNGDFNYDGVVNGTDYSLIDNTFNQIHATGASPLAIIDSPSILIASSSVSSVPEPTALGLLAVSASVLLGHRARRRVPLAQVAD
jgi:fibronectin-binding autotransporter adhesin